MPEPEPTSKDPRGHEAHEHDLDLDEDAPVDAADFMGDDETAEEAVVDVRRPASKKVASTISGRKFRKRDLVNIDELRPSLARNEP